MWSLLGRLHRGPQGAPLHLDESHCDNAEVGILSIRGCSTLQSACHIACQAPITSRGRRERASRMCRSRCSGGSAEGPRVRPYTWMKVTVIMPRSEF